VVLFKKSVLYAEVVGGGEPVADEPDVGKVEEVED